MKFNIHAPELAGWGIVPDIAGRYSEFIKLKKTCNQILALGDLNDRGLYSHKVFEHFINNPRDIAIKGNHEWMMQSFFLDESVEGKEDWLWLGGSTTIKGFVPDKLKNFVMTMINDFADEHSVLVGTATASDQELDSFFSRLNDFRDQMKKYISNEYFEYLKSMPLFYETEHCFFSHAPVHRDMQPDIAAQVLQGIEDGTYCLFLKNRSKPKPRSKIQFFGHLGLKKPKFYLANNSIYAVCLDASKGNKLVMYNGSTQEIEVEDYE